MGRLSEPVSIDKGARANVGARSSRPYFYSPPLWSFSPGEGERTPVTAFRSPPRRIYSPPGGRTFGFRYAPAVPGRGGIKVTSSSVGFSKVKNAEGLIEALRDRSEVEGPVFKMQDDPRVTLWLDFRIILQTVPAVLQGRGAH